MSTSTDVVLEMLRQHIVHVPEVEVTESTWDQFEAAQRELEAQSPPTVQGIDIDLDAGEWPPA